MLYLLPKATHHHQEYLIFSDGISKYFLENSGLESLFYSELMVAKKNNELIQIGEILDIDFFILTQRPKHLSPMEYESLQCDYDVLEYKDGKEAKVLKTKIANSKKNFITNYFSSNDGWADIQILKNTILELQRKISKTPNYHQQIKYNRPWWRKYFHMDQNTTTNYSEEKRQADRKKIQHDFLNKINDELLNKPINKTGSQNPDEGFIQRIEAIGKQQMEKHFKDYDDGKRLYKDLPLFLKKLEELQKEGYQYVTLFN